MSKKIEDYIIYAGKILGYIAPIAIFGGISCINPENNIEDYFGSYIAAGILSITPWISCKNTRKSLSGIVGESSEDLTSKILSKIKQI
jgi:hypothetical protein